MRVLIDGRPLIKQSAGIATYTIDAINAICKYLPDWELIIVTPQNIHNSIEGLPLDRIQVIVTPLITKRIPGALWCLLKLSYLAWKYNVDLLWSPNKLLPLYHIGKYKTLITVHDVVWKEFKNTTVHKWHTILFNHFFDRSIKKANYIWCNSEYTLRKLNQYFPNRQQKNVILGLACNPRYKIIELSESIVSQIYKDYDISSGFILFVGTIEPRKNLSFLLQLMPQIYERTGLQLLVVGAKGWKNSSLNSMMEENLCLQEIVRFTGFVTNDKLVELYNAAKCYISTSLNEGFGIPQLEAMSCGCPVISPHNSAMIEVVEGRGITIKGWEPKEWIDIICNVVSNPILLESMSHPDLSQFCWESIIKKLDTYIKCGEPLLE